MAGSQDTSEIRIPRPVRTLEGVFPKRGPRRKLFAKALRAELGRLGVKVGVKA